MNQYLHQLTLRLAAGVLQLPEATRHVHAAYVRSRQQADGGFPGREGGSDLYYTGFALRSLFLLGELSGPPADRAARTLVLCALYHKLYTQFMSPSAIPYMRLITGHFEVPVRRKRQE